MKQKFNKEQDHSTVYWDFSRVHVVSRKALKFFVSVGDTETESEDVRVWSGAKHCSSSRCSFTQRVMEEQGKGVVKYEMSDI